MPNYEIRLRKPHSRPRAFRANRTSDYAAICTAQSIAADGDTIEVWKGMVCIYAGEANAGPFSLNPSGGIFLPVRMNA